MIKLYRFGWLSCCLIAACLNSPGVQADSQQASAYYEDALVRFNNKEIDAAIIQLKNTIKENPNHLSAYILLARAYLLQNNGAAAEENLLLANKMGADRSLTIVLLAKAYLAQDKLQLLLNEIDPMPFDSTIKAELMTLFGNAYLQLNQLREAGEAFSKAQNLSPAQVQPIVGLATVFLRSKDFESARQYADRAIAHSPNSGEAWYIRASIKHAQGNLLGAIEDYNKTIELIPEHLNARSARAGVLIDLKNYDQALIDIKYLQQEYPEDPRSAYLHAVVLARQGDVEGAHTQLEKAAEVIDNAAPEIIRQHQQNLLLASLVNFSLHRFEKATEYLNIFIKNYPGHVGARKLLGSIMLENQNYQEVINTLQPVLNNASNDYRFLSILGTAYMKLDRHEKALELFEKAAELSNNDSEILTNLAINRLSSGQENQAIEELSTAFSQNAEQTNAGITLAMVHLKRREYEQALRVANTMIEQEPRDLIALNLAASAQLGLGHYDQARKLYLKSINIDKEFLSGAINLAKLDTLQGQFADAEHRLRQILETHPQHTRAMLELARVAQAQDDIPTALQWLEKAYSIDSKSLPVIEYLVDLYIADKKADKALKIAEDAERWAPRNMKVLFALSRSLLAVGNARIAKVVLRRMAKYAGFNSVLLYRIAQLQLTANDPQEAFWSLQKSIEGDTHYLPAHIALFETELKLGKYQDALQGALQLQQDYPDKAIGYQLSGRANMAIAHYAEAVANFRLAFAREKNTVSAIQLHQAMMLAGNTDEALDMLQAWIDHNPDDALSQLALAESYLRSEQWQAARKLYEALNTSHPEQPSVLNNLAYILSIQNDPQALSYARQAYRLAPDNPSVNDTLGWLLVKSGDPEAGLPLLRNAYSRNANNPEIRYHLGTALYQLKRYQEAKIELQKALASNPRFHGAEDAQKLLDAITSGS